jgi:uncharacterized membrane protein YkoI
MKKIIALVLAFVLMFALSITAFADSKALTLEEAKQIALEHVGAKEEEAKFTRAHKDFEHGREVYDLEFRVDGTEYDMDLDVMTGRITDYSEELHFTGTGSAAESTGDGMLTEEEAMQKAFERAKVTEDQIDFVKHVQLDYEHGREVYEIEFYCGGFEYNIDVDAHTGRIVDFDKDFD